MLISLEEALLLHVIDHFRAPVIGFLPQRNFVTSEPYIHIFFFDLTKRHRLCSLLSCRNQYLPSVLTLLTPLSARCWTNIPPSWPQRWTQGASLILQCAIILPRVASLAVYVSADKDLCYPSSPIDWTANLIAGFLVPQLNSLTCSLVGIVLLMGINGLLLRLSSGKSNAQDVCGP